MRINDAEFFKKLRSTFKIEAHEHVRAISLSLLDLEKTPIEEERKSIIERIHREFHSLKGASRAVSLKEIETICHASENIFSKIKKEVLPLSTEMFDVFNRAIDTIEDILCLQEGKSRDISEIMGELKKIETGNLVKSDWLKSVEVPKNLDNTNINRNTACKDVQEENTLITKKKEGKDATKEIQAQEHNIVKMHADRTSETVRVSKAKLDALLIQGEEMIYAKLSAIQRAKEIKEVKELVDLWKKEKRDTFIEKIEKKMVLLLKSTEDEVKIIEAMTDTFIEDVKDIMLFPFSLIVELFPKMVRDLSRHVEKEIEFICRGTEIEVDRRILDEIKDPLIHIIRNAIDHGIEKSEERKKLKKSPKGTIHLTISQVSSDRVKIEVADDGAGIDVDKIKNQAGKNKIFTKTQIDPMDDENTKMLIFKSGFSTSEIITDISGRGLGLAIVYEKVQKLEGTITVKSERGQGTTFTIILPITISTNRGIIVKVAKQDFVIPTGKVERVVTIKKDDIKIMENRDTIVLDDCIIPIVNLKNILEIQDKKAVEYARDTISVLVVNDLGSRIAFQVDEIIIEQEVLVKRFNKQLKKVRNVTGATILASGKVVPILDVQDLIKSSLQYANKSSGIKADNEKNEELKKSIIVVEDSITSRTLLKNILENNGYIVKTAVDGLAGWRMIKSQKFDLVITDVEMPEMDGFALTEIIRHDPEVSEIPVILVTSLESREDKERGVDVGASAYIVKSDFEQSNLLEIVKRLI
ncbi:response regulator [Clostridiaceae bacterium 35-E11]